MKKGLFQIFFANFLYLLLVAGNNFLLPKFTSVETYAAVKEYTLYLTTYGTILTFGYLHGMYLKYGGREIGTIEPEELGSSVLTFFVMMLPAAVAVSVYGLWTNNVVVCVVGAGLLSTNLCQYYQLFYQATGDFKSYGVALNASRILVLAADLLLIFVCKSDNKMLYVAVYPLIAVCSALYLTGKLNRKMHFLKCARFHLGAIKANTRGGMVLMLGEFVTRFFTSIDRWFVKYLMSTFSFAMYSFAVSMENMVNAFMTPITVSMYNFFCKKPDLEKIRQMKEVALIYSMIIIAGAFPCKWILENFMRDYLQASEVMYLLFAAQGISAIIRGIYVNKYKAENAQRKYLKQMAGMVVLSVVLNAVFYCAGKNMTVIAAATFATNLIWLALCEFQNPEIRFDGKTLIVSGTLLAVYFIAGYRMDAITGAVAYCATGLCMGVIFMHKSFVLVLGTIFDIIRKK